MGVTSQLLAQGSTFSYKDKEYTVSPNTLQVQGLFEQYLEDQAMEKYRRLAKKMSEAEAEASLKSVIRDAAVGHYTFGSPAVGDALQSPRHLKYLFFLCLKKNHPEVSRELVEEMAVSHYSQMVQAINRANADPDSTEASADGDPPTPPSPSPPA